MIDIRYQVTDTATGGQGFLRIAGGIWAGDACVFEFTDTLSGIAGTAVCDWRQSAPVLMVHEGDANTLAAKGLLARLGTLLLPFHRGAFRGVTDEQLRELYAGDYHRTMNYANGCSKETDFKRHVVDQVIALGAPGKVLDAGCSAGEVVKQLRARGVDAHGFDLCGDLAAIAYPDVAPFLRSGGVDAIPYRPEDGFTTLLALDVFEHVPEHKVAMMVAEFARLGVARVIAHIALCEFQYPGHLTLRPLSWWDRQLAPWFRRIVPATQARMAAAFGADPSKYLRVYELAEVPVSVR